MAVSFIDGGNRSILCEGILNVQLCTIKVILNRHF